MAIARNYLCSIKRIENYINHFKQQLVFINKEHSKLIEHAVLKDPTQIKSFPSAISIIKDKNKTFEMCKFCFNINPLYTYFIPTRIQNDPEFIDMVINTMYPSNNVFVNIPLREAFLSIVCDDLYEVCRCYEECSCL